jgi:lipoprotein NlpI
MGQIEKTVFISYRRTNVPWALAIFQSLTANGYDVFFDYNGVDSGGFERVILGSIKARAHFLVVLTPSALERCGDPEDWLRREIETAIDSQRNIVPLMMESFDFGTPAIARHLTGSLARLKKYNGLRIPADYFMEAMDRLRNRFLNVPLDTVLHPASATAGQIARDGQHAAATARTVENSELTAQEYFERGFDASDVDEKIRLYNNAIELKPDYYNAFNNRGNARYSKRDVEGALQDFDMAILLKPKFANTYNNRAIVRKAKGDLVGALEDYNEAIRLRPDSVITLSKAFSNRANVRRILGDLEGAFDDINFAIHLRPDSAEFFNSRGNVLVAKGDQKGALADYEEALRLMPTFEKALYNRDVLLGRKRGPK